MVVFPFERVRVVRVTVRVGLELRLRVVLVVAFRRVAELFLAFFVNRWVRVLFALVLVLAFAVDFERFPVVAASALEAPRNNGVAIKAIKAASVISLDTFMTNSSVLLFTYSQTPFS